MSYEIIILVLQLQAFGLKWSKSNYDYGYKDKHIISFVCLLVLGKTFVNG